jgi:hypothetical protein
LWPDGTIEPWQTVKANQFLVLKRGATAQLKQPG